MLSGLACSAFARGRGIVAGVRGRCRRSLLHCLAGSFFLPAFAFAPGAVAYQWYCDGEPIDGATGQTLDVSWSKSKEPAVYTVRATFSRFGVPVTRDASATVTSRPKGLTLRLR